MRTGIKDHTQSENGVIQGPSIVEEILKRKSEQWKEIEKQLREKYGKGKR